MKRIVGCLIISFFVSNACFSKITPKDGGDKIVIRKGDTLWSLAKKYYNDPNLWPKFLEFNIIDNPDKIYPGEKIAIGRDLALDLASAMRGRINRLEKEKVSLRKAISVLKKEKQELIEKYEEMVDDLKKHLPTDMELRLKHQAEIEFMEQEILALEAKILEKDKEKAKTDVELSARIQEIKEKKKEIQRREEEIRLLDEKLDWAHDEIYLLKTGIRELEERLKNQEIAIKERDRRIEELMEEKGLYSSFAHFLIFAIVSGLIALSVSN
ncbi:TPA: hypothetical protein DCX16_00110 [bacterium]|nr:hypothetical protein [bacterium]